MEHTRFLPSATAFYCLCQTFLLPKVVLSVAVESRLASEILNLNSLPNIQKPILIQNAIPQSERRRWWKHIQTRSKREMVLVDIQTNSFGENEEYGEERLQDALEKVQFSVEQENGDPIFVESIGSSCSTDQLPTYEYCQSFFSDPDILSKFSPYAPIHEQLVISCNQARSTLSSRYYTTTILSIGGGPIKYEMEAISQKTIESYKGSRAVTRTWDGDAFYIGWNSAKEKLMEKSEKDGDVLSVSVQPGDVLVVPKNWWFQSESQRKSANISVLGRRCGSREFEGLVQDILPPNLANRMLLALDENDDEEEKCQMLFQSIQLQNAG